MRNDQLILDNRDYAIKLTRKLLFKWGSSATYEDLSGLIDIKLIECASRFDESRGVPFKSFLSIYTSGAVKDYFRSENKFQRESGRYQESINYHELSDQFLDIISMIKQYEFDELELAIIRNLLFEDKTLVEVGKKMGVSKSRVHKKAKIVAEVFKGFYC